MEIPINIGVFTWLFYWLVVWGLYFVLEKKGIDYIKNYLATSIYFLIAGLIPIIIFSEKFFSLLTPFNLLSIIILITTLLITNYLIFIMRKRFKTPKKLKNKNPKIYFLSFDARFNFSNAFDIFFQQVMIILLILFLNDKGYDALSISIAFCIIFGLAHLPIIKYKGLLFGSYYTIAAISSALLFPFIILNVPYGFIYAYLIHWMFYIVSEITFWIIGYHREKSFFEKLIDKIKILNLKINKKNKKLFR